MKTQITNTVDAVTNSSRTIRNSVETQVTRWVLTPLVMLILLLQVSSPVQAQDTHLKALELVNQLYSKPKNIKRQGVMDLARFPGHGAMDKDAHYQGITRHKQAIYLTSSFPNGFSGGRLLVLNANKVETRLPKPFSHITQRHFMFPKAVGEFRDCERDENRRPEHLYWHYGGMDTCKDILVVAAEYTNPIYENREINFAGKKVTIPVKVGTDKKGAVLFFDVSEPLNPRFMKESTFEADYLEKCGAVGITQGKDGSWLMATVGGSEGVVRLYESYHAEGEDFDFQLVETYKDDKAAVYQTVSLVTTSDDSVFLLGTYNDEYAVDELKNGLPIGRNMVGLTWLSGHKYKGANWKPVILSSREFDLWKGYDSVAEAGSGFSIGSLIVGVFTAPVIGPAAFAIPLASTGITYSQIKKDFEHPNFDGGGGVLIDENGNLEIWASSHGRGGGKQQIPRFSTSW